METIEILTLLAIIVTFGTYYAGVKRGEAKERRRRQYELDMEEDRRLYELKSKLVDNCVGMVDRCKDTGPSALARLDLHQLKSDQRIREAIEEIKARTDLDPWEGREADIQDVDLVKFFKYIREHKIKFGHMGNSVEDVVKRVKELD
jgi:hypothetical protein